MKLFTADTVGGHRPKEGGASRSPEAARRDAVAWSAEVAIPQALGGTGLEYQELVTTINAEEDPAAAAMAPAVDAIFETMPDQVDALNRRAAAGPVTGNPAMTAAQVQRPDVMAAPLQQPEML